MVHWNREQDGFRVEWLWQFGAGPFEVVEIYDIPAETRSFSDYFKEETLIPFEGGHWYLIAIPDAAYQYRVEYQVTHMMFHKKWFQAPRK